jgi:hypothetical protein
VSSTTLGRLGEGRVSRKAALSKWRKIGAFGLAGLAARSEKRYIGSTFGISYDRVLRVGPSGPALFYYLNEAGRTLNGAGRLG